VFSLLLLLFEFSSQDNNVKDQIKKNQEMLEELRNKEKEAEAKNKAMMELKKKKDAEILAKHRANNSFVACKVLQFNILQTWGDAHYVGLTGIELYGKRTRVCSYLLSFLR
jgi:putative protein kinase ArgK-like GTPase of G3E family